MGTTSSFFGGGGGGAVLDAPNQNFVNTVDFAANTQFSVPSTNRGQRPRVIPCKSNTFFLLEGDDTSRVYVSYWSIDDSGAATQEATAIQIHSGAQQVRAAAANGIDRLIVQTWEGGAQRIRQIYYNGSTLSESSLAYVSTTAYWSTSTVTCTSDGVLLGTLGRNSGNAQENTCGAVMPDGTTATLAFTSQFHENHGRFIGVADGIIGCGRRSNQSTQMAGQKIYINPVNNSTLFNIANANRYHNESGAYNISDNNPPYVLPTKGGACAAFLDGNSDLSEYSLTSFGPAINILPNHNRRPANMRLTNNNALSFSLGVDSTFCRQANGTYLNFIEQSSSHFVTFDEENFSHHAPFGSIRPVGDAGSSGCTTQISTAIVGKFVISTWYDQTDGDVNIDAWNYRG